MESILLRLSEAVLRPFLVLLFAAALVYFLWGVYIFIKNADAPEERAIGRRHMIYAIIGLVIMVAVRSIITILLNTFGISL